MPTVSQLLTASFEKVLSKMPTNQWAENAMLREMERQGMIKRISFGTQLEEPLDYRRNPDAGFLASDLQPTSLTKTEVLTAAQYDSGQLIVPITWSFADEAKNSSDVRKVALVKSLIENAAETHDELIEEAVFAISTDGVLGLQTIVPDSGQGTVGGINAATDAWWRNTSGTYLAAGTDILAKLNAAFNDAAKGTGGAQPSLLVSDGDAQAIYEGALQPNQRYIDTKEGDAGFKTLAYKTARYIFSHKANTRIYGLSKKVFRLNVSKDAYRQKGETMEIQNAAGRTVKMYSMLQFTTSNKSRQFVLTQA